MRKNISAILTQEGIVMQPYGERRKVKDMHLGEWGWVVGWAVDPKTFHLDVDAVFRPEKFGTWDVHVYKRRDGLFDVDISKSYHRWDT